MSDEDKAQAKKSVESILSALDVARVVYVDDANGNDIPIEKVITAAFVLEAEVLLVAFPELGDSIPDDQTVRSNKIREAWERLDPAVQQKRGQAVLAAAPPLDGDEANDATYVAILCELIPEAKLVSLSPLQWEAQQDQLLRDSMEQNTLFLFDKDLSKAGGDTKGGIKIIATLLARDDAERLLCGLLTHTVSPETQPQQWDELSREYSIPKDRFVLIPKLHLCDAPMMFAQLLKFTALSSHFAELKRKTKDIIKNAAGIAADKVDEVNIYDFDHIVFQVSAAEGLWEPDMLFRLHAMFHRMASRRLTHDDGALETIAAKLRAVSGILTECASFPTPTSAWELQREELYEFDDHINKNHLPLELGDIFERVDGDSIKKYILLAQPCDLMVRGNGKRQPELHRVPLAEVVSREDKPHYSEELPYFDPSSSRKWFVKLKTVHFVRGCLLDLCVFNQDGVAKLDLNGSAPSGMRPAWQRRYDVISHHWRKAVQKIASLEPLARESRDVGDAKRMIKSELGGLLFNDDPFKGTPENAGGVRSITYDCKRIARLSRAQAIGLLMSYTATLGRPAYERDFGKVSGGSA